MHDTTVKMKDGRSFCGPIWSWRPEEGWFSIVGEEPIDFRDVESAVTKGQRVRAGKDPIDEDELQRARSCGWDGT